MPDDAQGSDRGTLRQVAWRELLPWLCILRSFRLAIDPRQLLLAAVGLLLTAGGWWVLGLVFSGADHAKTKQVVESYRVWPWSPGQLEAANDASVSKIPRAPSAPRPEEFRVITATSSWFVASPPSVWPHNQPIQGTWYVLSRPFLQLFDRRLDVAGFALVLLCALWAAAVWALFGGAITRLAAMRLTRDERVSLGHGIRHARQRWGGYFWAPIFPLIGALLPTLGLAAVGWLLRFDFGIIVLGILLPLLLVGGLLLAILLLGLTFGWPLMWATISAEGTDTFDALSRTYAYVYQRPLSYLFYVVITSLFGLLGGLLAFAFGLAVVYLTWWGVSWSAGPARTEQVVAQVGQWVAIARPMPVAEPAAIMTTVPAGGNAEAGAAPPEPAPLSTTGVFGARLVAIWIGGVELLIVAFNVSFFWCAATAVYLLMRKQVDATEIDEVYIEEEEERYGLPPLEADAAGVPQAADIEADNSSKSDNSSQ